jgi:hypothetical protein
MKELSAGSESAFLTAGVNALRALLEPRSFCFQADTSATSSRGSFAAGYFRRPDLEIGLIVRNGSQLGCPNYSAGRGFAGHGDLVAALGAAGREKLIEGPHLEFVSRNGGPAFDAFHADLETFILPALDRSTEEFHASLAAAVRTGQARLGF